MSNKNPSPTTRFKKGVSGNPNGKPPGTLSMTNKIKEFLLEMGKDGETHGDKLKRAIVLRAITKSDVLAKEILDRVDGKVPQQTDVTSGGKPISFDTKSLTNEQLERLISESGTSKKGTSEAEVA